MAKNTHLEHIEDELINNGYAGGSNAIKFLESLRDMLGATGTGTTKVTVKWDGAPAIVCGKDPNGQFFVGTKSVFNKGQPKIGYDHELIDFHYESSPVKDVLHQCYDAFKELPISGVLQGDLLYTKTPPVATLSGKTGYKFKPNTIVYFVEKGTPLGDKVGASNFGIVFHTSYSGTTVDSMSASFGVDVSGLQGTPSVAVFSSEFQNLNGVANLSKSDKQNFNKQIVIAKSGITKGRNFLDLLGGKKPFEFTALFKMYFNQVVRSGNIPSSSAVMLRSFVIFVTERFDMEIAKKKTEKAQKQWEKKKESTIKYLNNNKTAIHNAMNAFTALMTAKNIIISRLQKVKGIGTFIEDEDGYRVTSPEGFVAIKDGTAMKLVDRLEFSRANFTVAKNWG
tara:strand:- start:3954 stop:5138 length:1185 start_codon:yes stop_codon:yes gene_type:complete